MGVSVRFKRTMSCIISNVYIDWITILYHTIKYISAYVLQIFEKVQLFIEDSGVKGEVNVFLFVCFKDKVLLFHPR